MHKFRLVFNPLIIVLCILFLSACSALPASIRGIFATIPTKTPTPTPAPAVDLSPCAFAAYCPDVKNVLEYVEEEVEAGGTYFVNVPYELPLNFRVGWTVIDQDTLEQNLERMRFFFEIDGQSYFNEAYVVNDFVQDIQDPTLTYPAVALGYITDGWQVGQPHKVHIGFEFLEEVFDGWDTYPAGTLYEYTYFISPQFMPTATPTNTPLPVPTAVPPTPTLSCDLSASINIINDTGGQVTLYFTGPAKLTFYVDTGTHQVSICPGTYNYTAYGCGGASISGTAGDGDEIEFWCE